MNKTPNIKAHLALLFANSIYGLNYVIAKGIMPDFMSPRAIIFVRILGAFLVFKLVHWLFVKEKIDKKDMLRLAACGAFGVAINQIMFFEGLNLTTAINASIIMTVSPILVLVFAFMFLHEKINILKITGVVLGALGAGILILAKGNISFQSHTFTGNFFVFINATAFAFYLILVKPMMIKYNPVTVMCHTFTFGFLYTIPFCINPFLQTDFSNIPVNIWLSVCYVIFATTILAYFLLNFSLQYVSPVLTSSYMYSQPLIATLVAVFYAGEILGMTDILAAALIFTGVYLVSIHKAKAISVKR